MDVYLITDLPATGAWNMGVDEALREWAAENEAAVVRFYEWSPATLSLGYFQSCRAREEHRESRDLPVVRRASGGGAIVHDRELTYSLALGVANPSAVDAQCLVSAFHRCLVHALSDWEITARLCAAQSAVPGSSEPFLCFQRRACGDVLLAEDKVAGSAQRRMRGSLLQHGSVLLERSPAASVLPGICDLAGRTITADELQRNWAAHLGRHLEWSFVPWEIDGRLRERASYWTNQRFASPAWTAKR
jgi:lipoate-protein ligase A